MESWCVLVFVLHVLDLHQTIDAASDMTILNVARGKPCHMSTVYGGVHPENLCGAAINGNTGTVFVSGNCIHTEPNDHNPSWNVDLGILYDIVSITVYGRTDGVESDYRLSGVTISIDGRVVSSYQSGHMLTVLIGSQTPARGRYITLTRNRALLNICEVQVFASVPSYRNIAQGKQCDMTRPYYWDATRDWRDTTNNTCSAANNGNPDTTYVKGNCIWTHWTDRNPHWTVQLGAGNFSIHHIVVFAVQDNGRAALVHMLNVRVLIDEVVVFTFPNTEPAITFQTDIFIIPPRSGHRVTLSRLDQGPLMTSGYTYLRFCEVQVWGECAEGYYGTPCDQRCRAGCRMDTCHDLTGHCTCQYGWKAPDCASCAAGHYNESGGCAQQCGHCREGTVCDTHTGRCPAGCKPGWVMPLCQQVCHAGYYGDACSKTCGQGCEGHVCNNVDGSCGCRGRWTHGANGHCSECAAGYYNVSNDCGQECGHCTGGHSCNKDTGHCVSCAPGFIPPLCQDVCQAGYYGDACSKTCGQGCEGHVCNNVDGSCRCPTGWTHGANGSCSECANGYYNASRDCGQQCGHCTGDQSCDKDTGHCVSCAPGFIPPLCADACPVGYYGDACSKTCGQGCDGHVCNKVDGSCRCTRGWTSSTHGSCWACMDGQYGVDCLQTCGHCANNATCLKTNGTCPLQLGTSHLCDDGFEPPLCQQAVSANLDSQVPGSSLIIIASSVSGSGIFIAVAVVATLCWLKRRNNSNRMGDPTQRQLQASNKNGVVRLSSMPPVSSPIQPSSSTEVPKGNDDESVYEVIRENVYDSFRFYSNDASLQNDVYHNLKT